MYLFFFGLGCTKYGAPNSDLFAFSRNASRTNNSTYFLKIYSFNFGNRCGSKHIDFEFSLDSKSTGSIFQVLSAPSNSSLKFCNRLI